MATAIERPTGVAVDQRPHDASVGATDCVSALLVTSSACDATKADGQKDQAGKVALSATLADWTSQESYLVASSEPVEARRCRRCPHWYPTCDRGTVAVRDGPR